MTYVFVENFKAGTDVRHRRVNGKPGSLYSLVNAHITRGGDVERRKKFVSTYSLPSGTHGLHALSGDLYVFGHAADPGVPSGITYQRLRHVDGSTALSKVLDTANFNGKVYAVAEFEDGDVYHFWDGAIVPAWYAGRITSVMSDINGIADHFRSLIDSHEAFSATRSSATVVVTGEENEEFDVSIDTENVEGGTDDQDVSVVTTQTAVADQEEARATASFRIIGGSASAGTNKISDITVDSVSIIGSAVDWRSSNAITAADVAAEINLHSSSPNYTAVAEDDTVVITAEPGTGDTPNDYELAVDAEGDVIVTYGSFTITGGTSNPGTNEISEVLVNGVDILGSAVDWTTSHTDTAEAVAAQIRSNTSSPDYVAFADGVTVYIGAASATGTTPKAFTLKVTVGGDVTKADATDVDTSLSDMSGGSDDVAGQPQVTELTFEGTFDVGDKFNVTLGDYSFGYIGNPEQTGRTALTFHSKLYSTVSSLLYYSGVYDASVWNRDDLVTPGANFRDLASHDESLQDLTALQIYQGNLAVFARDAVQILYVEADEDNNQPLQTLENTGTRSPHSVRSFGDKDVFYLSDSGIRSLRARDSSNAAYVDDVGTAIDPMVLDHMETLTDDQIESACAVLEPRDDRYWLALGSRIFVFSYFPGAKISAWSYYDVADDIGGDVEKLVRSEGRVYARSGDTVYLYGGTGNDTHPDADEVEVEVGLPFLDADRPATFKSLIGFDQAATNEWYVKVLVNPDDESDYIEVGRLTGTTYSEPKQPMQQEVTHFAPVLTCSAAGAATLSSVAIHYKAPHEDG